jgi:methylglutaconyl-CoA hydratase
MLKVSARAAWLQRSRSLRLTSRRSYSSSADTSTILVQHHPAPQSGSIRVLLLDRLEARNALSKQLIAGLRSHVDEIQAKGATGGIRALIIASNSDKVFCAGADLRERRTMSQDEPVKQIYMMRS